MNIKKILQCVVFCLSVLNETSFAAAADFLNIGVGAKAVSMGGAYSSCGDDITGLYWNPALLSDINRNEFSTMYVKWFEDMEYSFAAYNKALSNSKNISLSLYNFNIGDIQGYSYTGAATKKLDASDRMLALTYSMAITDRLYGGLSLKYLTETLDDTSATTMLTDIGSVFKLTEYFKVALVAKNMGGALKFINESDKINNEIRFGASWLIPSAGFLFSSDIVSVDGGTYEEFGGEYEVTDYLSLRLGYRGDQDLGSGLKYGLGIKSGNLAFDYAFANYGDLGNTSFFNFSIRFGQLHRAHALKAEVGEIISKGMKDYRDQDLINAYSEFERVLWLEPGNKIALEYKSRIEADFKKLNSLQEINKHIITAKKLHKQGNYLDEKAELEKILALAPDHTKAKELLVRVELKLEEIKAQEILGYLKDAGGYYDKGKYVKCNEMLDKILVLDPENIEGLNLKRDVTARLKEIQDKKLELEKQKNKEEKRLQIEKMLRQADKYFQSRKYVKSLENYEEVLKLDLSEERAVKGISKSKREIIYIYSKKASAARKKSKFEEAISYYEKILKYKPGLTKIKKSLEQVKADFQVYKNKQSDEFYRRGLEFYKAGDKNKAVEIWRQALEYNPDNITARRALERAEGELNQ